MAPHRGFCYGTIWLLSATLLIVTVTRVSALHGLGGEGYSVWKGDESVQNAPEHNCDGHHDSDHHHGGVKGAHDHSHQSAHSHDHAHSHGHTHEGHSHGGNSHSGHSHGHAHSDSHSHDGHSHEGHSHGSHSHSGHSHDHSAPKDRRPKTLEELELEELANHGFATATDEDYVPLSQWDRLALSLGGSSWGTWVMAMGSSLAVSLCSLICLIILPFILREGQTPSEQVVRILTGFGAGAMVGDAFLHQLPHAFGSGGAHSHGGQSHGADSHGAHSHDHGHDHSSKGGGHAHSIEDLSVGLAVLVGLIVFFLVEKAVRYVEEATAKNPEIEKQISFQKQHSHKHGHRGHSHEDAGGHSHQEDDDVDKTSDAANGATEAGDTTAGEENGAKPESVKKRKGGKKSGGAVKTSSDKEETTKEDTIAVVNGKENSAVSGNPEKKGVKGPAVAPGSLLVLGYLNLFSDGVHNFTDGMALGAAFLHHGAVGGWSRTLFMLAHELPQEVGDFGILVRAGFSVTKALALNFLSASMAMAGTAFALVVGGDASNSSIIEGFTAGGFVYIAVAGVMPDLHAQGTSGLVTFQQVLSMLAGMGVALGISLWE